jgi:hypothetical protein
VATETGRRADNRPLRDDARRIMETRQMTRQGWIGTAAIAALVALGAAPARAQTDESKTHELACTAATVGGAVAGVALGSLLGGGLGRSLFMTAGGVAGGMAGHAMKCPGK